MYSVWFCDLEKAIKVLKEKVEQIKDKVSDKTNK